MQLDTLGLVGIDDVLVAACPNWCAGALLLRDANGDLAAVGALSRRADGTVAVTLSAVPPNVQSLCASPPAARG